MAASGLPGDPVSPAEGRVLAQLMLGLSNKAIAAALALSPRTVEGHVSNLLAKTGCASRSALLLWALSAERDAGDTVPETAAAANRHEPWLPA
jgi:DNA-binding CsgD family transcriptional regulator